MEDLGKNLGVGAHMLELRRTTAGIFFEDDESYPSVNLYDFEKAFSEWKKGNDENLRKILIPGEIVAQIYLPVFIKDTNLKKILTGKPVYFDDLEKIEEFEKGKIISVFCRGDFVGMYLVVNDGYVFAKPEFVMQKICG